MIPVGIKVMNESNLAQWYDPLSLCMLQSYKNNTFAQNESYHHVLDSCKQGLQGRYPHGFKILPSSAYTNKVRSVCCVEDLALTDRGFDWVVDGYEDGTVTPVLDMFLAMSKRNLSILLMGDSVNRQIYGALMEELIREKGDVCGTLREFHMHGERWWFDGLPKKVLPSFPQSASWTPNASCFSSYQQPLNTVYMYDVNMWYFSQWDELWVRDKVIPQLLLNDHPSGLVFFANLGHHLSNERKSADPSTMYMKISWLLNWMYALSVLSPGSLMVWRESTPAHFNAPDGQFEIYEQSPNNQFPFQQPNYWDHTMYACRAMEFELSNNNSKTQTDNHISDNTTTTTTTTIATAVNTATAVSRMRQQAQRHQFRENRYAREILAVWECWDREENVFVCNVTETLAKQQMSSVLGKSHPQSFPQSYPQSSTSSHHNIRILSVFEFLAPFYAVKYGNCGSYGRVSSLDCVHYCSNAIPMWMPIWYLISA